MRFHIFFNLLDFFSKNMTLIVKEKYNKNILIIKLNVAMWIIEILPPQIAENVPTSFIRTRYYIFLIRVIMQMK